MMIHLVKKYSAVLLFLGLWETASRTKLVNPLFIPPFSEVVAMIGNLTVSGVLLQHIGISVLRAMTGFAVAVLVSIPLGAALAGGPRNLQTAIETLIEVFSQINPFIFFHILLLFLGIGETTKIMMIAWTCTWPVLFSTFSGVRSIEPEIIKTARTFRLRPRQMFFKVLLPGAVPDIFTGVRLSASYSFLLLIAAEMMGASSGLGWLVTSAQNGYQVVKVFVGVTVIALLGLLIDSGMEALENRIVVQE